MTRHPDDATLARALESTETDTQLAPHLATCRTCSERSAHLARVHAALGALPVPSSDPHLAHDVLARLSPRRAPPLGLLLGLGLGLSAAAALVAVGVTTPHPDPGTFTARGGSTPGSSEASAPLTLSAYLQPSEGPRTPLGPRFTRGDALSFRVIRRDAATRAYLMVFGCDAANEMTWAAPTWDDPATDPVGVPLEPGVPLYDLPSALIPEGPPGPFTLVALTTSTPVGVRRLESLVHTCADLDTLGTLPGAVLTRLPLHLDPPNPARHP